MARKGHGRPASLVNIGTHPDDTSSPVGSNEWNANRDTTGVIGFTKKTEAISSYAIDVTDSYVEVTNAGDIRTMDQVATALSTDYYPSDTSTKSFSEGDLLYVVKASGVGTVNLINQYGSSGGAGKITTLSGSTQTLDVNIPRIFMCRTISGVQEWIEYGGGSASDLDTTNFATGIIQDDDSFASPAATKLATSESIKAYIATQETTGDITGVTAGDGLTGGGSSGAVTLTVVGGTGITASADEITIDGTVATLTGTQTLENKTVDLGDNTLTGSIAEFNTALQSESFATLGGSETLASKTLTAPVLTGAATAVDLTLSGRLKADKGANVVSATNMTLGADGNTFRITATNTIVTIVTTNWTTGSVIHLNFAGVLTVTNGTGAGAIRLGDQANMTTAAEDTLSLFYNGTEWVEISRSTVGGAGLGGTATDHIDMTGAYAIRDVDLLFLEHKSDTYISGGSAAAADITDQSQLFVEQIDTNNDALYIRLRLNGSTQNVRLA